MKLLFCKSACLKKLILIVLMISSGLYAAEESSVLNLSELAESLGIKVYDSFRVLFDRISFDGWLPELTDQKDGDFFSSAGTANILGQKVNIYLITKKDPKELGLETIDGQQKALEKAAQAGDLISIAFTIPKNFKLGSMSTYLGFLDQLGLDGSIFVLSHEKYKDSRFGDIDEGLNLVGDISFSSGIFSMINSWSKKMLNLSLDKGIRVQTLVPKNLSEISISIALPDGVKYPILGVNSGELPIEVFDIRLIIDYKGLSGSAFLKPISLAGVTVSGQDSNPGVLMSFTFEIWNLYELSRLFLTFKTEDLAKLTQLNVRGNVAISAPGLGGIISGPANISLSKDGIKADFNGDIIKGFLDAQIEAQTDISNVSNWNITGNFNQRALKAFKTLMADKAEEFKKKVSKGIDDAKAEVKKWEDKVAELGKQRKEIERENLKNIRKAKANVQRDIDQLDALKKKLDDAQRRCG